MLKPSLRNNLYALYLGFQTSVLVFFVLLFLKSSTIAIPSYYSLLPIFGFLLANYIADIFFKNFKQLISFVRFLIIGTSNTVVDFFVFNLLLSYFGAPFFIFAKIISFFFALCHSFYWNSIWSFESDRRIDVKVTSKFLFVTLIGFGINISVSYLALNFLTPLGIFDFQINANIANLLATIFNLFWNFLGYKIFVFKK